MKQLVKKTKTKKMFLPTQKKTTAAVNHKAQKNTSS